MTVRQIFVSATGALHPPWRIVVFCLSTMVALGASGFFLGPLVTEALASAGIHGAGAESWIELGGLLGGTAITVRLVDKRPWREVWLDREAARPVYWLFGFALGAACIAIPILLLVATRWLRVAPGDAGSWWGAMVRVSVVLIPAALVEELVARGYILSVLRTWWGWRWAIAVTSAGFGVLHLGNSGASVESIGLVTLAGVFLSAVLYATRSLYAAWMAHFAWNWTMAAVFHAAVSGYPFEAPRYRYVDAGPDWATGGEWGPEGGIPAGLGMVAGAAVLLVGPGTLRRRIRGEHPVTSASKSGDEEK